MKQFLVISIALLDADSYFNSGVGQALSGYFSQRDVTVSFIYDPQQATDADIVFQPVAHGELTHYCHTSTAEGNSEQLRFFILDKNDRDRNALPDCVSVAGRIYRNESAKSLLAKVERVLYLREHAPDLFQRCSGCKNRRLTEQETRVMGYMGRGFSPSQISRILNIAPKTVSSHKCTVMRKLHLTRNNELYHWLRQSGFIHIAR